MKVLSQLYISLSLITILIVVSENLIFIHFLYILGIIIVMYSAKFEVTHPFVWYIPFYYLYNNSLSILEAFNVGYLSNAILITKISWFALLAFILIVTPRIYSNKIMEIKEKTRISYFLYVLYSAGTLAIIYLLYIIAKGYTNKYQINGDDSFIMKFSLMFHIYLLSYIVILILKLLKEKKIPYLFIGLNLIFIVFSFSVTGERDLLLRMLLITVLLINIFYMKISKTTLAILFFSGLALVPILSNFKNVFLTKSTTGTMNDQNIFVSILNSDFSTGIRNFDRLINYDIEYLYGKTLIEGFLRVFSQEFKSATQWFNETFFPALVARGGGNGFSFLGEGYLNFGIYGSIIWMIMLGMILKKLYRYSNKNLIMLILYIYSMPIFIYVNRADYANLFSGILKVSLLSILILFFGNYVYNEIFKRRSKQLYDRKRTI